MASILLSAPAVSLARELIADIKAHGPMPVGDYMARCNAHYYATRDPFGTSGDFITSPEISQIFGELIGAWMADIWQRGGWPQAVLCEAGPGRGTLMKDALRATRSVPGFHDALDIHLIETSPHLRKLQQDTLNNYTNITWQNTLDTLPPLPLLFIANEFFDALPVEQYIAPSLTLPLKGEGSGALRRGWGHNESHQDIIRKVSHNGEHLVFEPTGQVVRETSETSLQIMSTIAKHIAQFGGAGLIIDYGYIHPSPHRGEDRWGAGKAITAQKSPLPTPPPTGEGTTNADTLQAVRNHQFADILENPGEADITAHVDFGALANAAKRAGAHTYGPIEQGAFLKRLGAELRATALCKSANTAQQKTILSGLERLVAPHQMGQLFKVLAITSMLDVPAGF